MRGGHSKPLDERVFTKVLCNLQTQCWEWIGCLRKDGYGAITIGGRHGAAELAHRVVWIMICGPIPDGKWVLHRCDVNYPTGDIGYRKCVNPAHMFLGDNQANMDDMHSKGRGVLPKRQPSYAERARGSHHGVAKLTESQVAEIRRRYGPPVGRACKSPFGISQAQLANEYGVHQGSISRVIRGQYWQHVD